MCCGPCPSQMRHHGGTVIETASITKPARCRGYLEQQLHKSSRRSSSAVCSPWPVRLSRVCRDRTPSAAHAGDPEHEQHSSSSSSSVLKPQQQQCVKTTQYHTELQSQAHNNSQHPPPPAIPHPTPPHQHTHVVVLQRYLFPLFSPISYLKAHTHTHTTCFHVSPT